MTTEKVKGYYIKKKRILLRTFDAALTIGKNVLIAYFGESKYNEMSTTIRDEFEKLIPQIPYIGGDDNPGTEALINCIILLPLLQFFEEEGLDYYEIGKLIYDLHEVFYKVILPKDDIFSEEFIDYEKERAKNSKLRKYPDDWVFDFIKSDGKNFTYGMDYSECGVHKFYKAQGAERFMPLVCIVDLAQAQVYGYGLYRTQTIGNGAPLCDFRYVKNGNTPRAWPPDNLPEFKKK